MKLPRRKFLHVAAGAAVFPALSRFARADTYPSRPVRIIVGFGAGGSPDILARLTAQWLSERLGQQFIVENRPGGGTNLATEAVVRAAPDGYTLLTVSSANAINATLYDNLSYNFMRDIAPVAGTVRVPQVVVVNPSLPAKTIPELIAFARANPGTINIASSGTGNLSHLSGELFKMMTGINMVPVPYRSSPAAQTDLLNGRVQVMFDTVPTLIEHIKAGTLRALAVTTTTKSDALPDLPTMDEFVPGYEVSGLGGIGAPMNTSAEVISRLNIEINSGLTDPKLKARFADLGATPLPGAPADFGKLVAEDIEKWAKVIKFANIKPE
jgi:tripartite-type tricarboxylate transporter receptor subunit TctC